MNQNKRKRKTFLTVQQKMTILDELNKGVSLKRFARKYKVSVYIIYGIRRQAYDLSNFGKRGGHLLQRKNRRRSPYEEIKNRLYSWIQDQQATGNPLYDRLIQKKALEFSKERGSTSFLGSKGWLFKFKNRYGIDPCRSAFK
jgi:predicted DNA-binding protein YlxM (UPF0122 family)